MKNDFDSNWLELRYEADAEARKEVIEDCLQQLELNGPLKILDIGSGTGNNARYLIPELVNSGIVDQDWLLIDKDPDLLRIAMKRLDQLRDGLEDTDLKMDILVTDLSKELEKIPFREADIVVSSALLDLVSKEWIERFVERLLKSMVKYVLISLTVDGRMEWWPKHPMDETMSDLFNRDMFRDKGFGPALGMNSSDLLKGSLTKADYHVKEMDTSWRIGPGRKNLQKRYLEDLFSAVTNGDMKNDLESVKKWKDHRISIIEAGESRLMVGHTDILGIKR